MQDQETPVAPSVSGMFAMPANTAERPAVPPSPHMAAHHHPGEQRLPVESPEFSRPSFTPPEPPRPQTVDVTFGGRPADQPQPVVKVLSVRGVEYGLMTLMVWFYSAALIWILLAIVNARASFDMLAAPLALLITALPVFAFLFVRLRRAELADPALRFEPSKRRFSQVTQFVTFLICFFNIVTFVGGLISTIGGKDASLDKSFLNMLVILVVAGGVFAYYWFDEHRLIKR